MSQLCEGAACSSFTNQCRAHLFALPGDEIPGQVDVTGAPTRNFSNSWGVNYSTCEQYCGFSSIPMTAGADFISFSLAMTSYFLPWLTLTAQLPFENAGPSETFTGLTLAIGSPALITYSLTLTLLNRVWAIKKVQTIINKSQSLRRNRSDLRELYLGFEERLQSFLYLAVEAQQVPLRASVVNHWLSSLIVSPANTDYWTSVRERVTASRRQQTLSLHAQISLATLVWIFTFVTGVSVATGAITVAVQIATSTLWVWLIPICWGWIWVGTQSNRGSYTIVNALQSSTAYCARVAGFNPPHNMTTEGTQEGIIVDTTGSGLTKEPQKSDPHRANAPALPDPPELPLAMLMRVRGDEGEEGGTYTYARAFTWWAFTQRIVNAFQATLNNMERNFECIGIPPSGQMPQQGRPLQEAQVAAPAPNPGGGGAALSILEGNGWQTSQYAQLPHNGTSIPTPAHGPQQPGIPLTSLGSHPPTTPAPVRAYTNLSEIDGEVYKRMINALLVALFAQWGTTGGAIIIAYFTPMVGFGCRSGTYVLYGVLATAVLFLLVISMVLSHQAMKIYQDAHVKENVSHFNTWEDRTWSHWVLCVLANVTRFLGKFLAAVNSIILILIAVFEFLGLFDNCWCKSCKLSRGEGGYVVLFRSNDDYRRIAQGAWVGGISMATVVCLILICIFFFSSRTKLKLS